MDLIKTIAVALLAVVCLIALQTFFAVVFGVTTLIAATTIGIEWSSATTVSNKAAEIGWDLAGISLIAFCFYQLGKIDGREEVYGHVEKS